MSIKNPPYPDFIATKPQHEAFVAEHERRFALDGSIYCSRICNLFAPGLARFGPEEATCIGSGDLTRPMCAEAGLAARQPPEGLPAIHEELDREQPGQARETAAQARATLGRTGRRRRRRTISKAS